VVSYPRQIPAGGEGTVQLKVNTNGYGGHQFKKTATVQSNDPQRPEFQLTISGFVAPFAEISPERVVFRGYAGQPMQTRIVVRTRPQYPFQLTGVETKYGGNVKFEWSTEKTAQGLEYVIEVQNVKTSPGKYYEILLLKTDSKLKPQIPISIYGSIAAAADRPAN
jgi:hypothetical protein